MSAKEMFEKLNYSWKDEIKFCLSKKRLLEIGKYINRQLIIHRNVEHDGNWTTEEKMIVQLYDFVVALLDYITNSQQKLEYYENIDPDKTIDKFRQKINKEMFNLQEENKELKHKLEQISEKVDYKLKIDKARRCIKNIFEDENWYENYEYNDLEYKLKEVDKILQGDDNNG